MRCLGLLLLVWAGSGCAFLNRDNLLLFDAFERHLVPDAGEATAAHVATAPLTYPSGLVLIVLDAFLTHPVLIVDDAWRDTEEALWDDFDWREQYVTELAVLPFRTLGTPLLLLASFFGRSMFDFPPRGEVDPVENPEDPAEPWWEFEDRVRALLAVEDFETARALMEGRSTESREEAAWRAAWLAVCAAGLGDAPGCRAWLQQAGSLAYLDSAGSDLLGAFIAAGPIGLRLETAERLRRIGGSIRGPLLRALLRDPDPVVRYLAVRALDNPDEVPQDLRTPLLQDVSPTVRDAWQRLAPDASGQD